MKGFFVFLCLVLVATGCAPKKEKGATSGPLSAMKEYQVIPVLPHFKISDRDMLFTHLVELLGQLGTVHISTGCFSDAPSSSAVMVIAIDEFEQIKNGSIKIMAEGEVLINKNKASCDVWETFFQDPTSSYPVKEENGIAFRRDLKAESPDLKAVATQMVEQFAKQYRLDNPKSKPTFHVYSKVF